MKNSKRLSWIACLTTMSAIFVSTESRAGTLVGSFQGVANVQVKQYLNNQLVGYIDAYDVPATLNFVLYTIPGLPFGTLQLTIATSAYVASFMAPGTASIIDGIPGQSADYANGYGTASDYYELETTKLALVDPSGEFIGPNGNGDPSDVAIVASMNYGTVSRVFVTGDLVVASFQTVPEPSSIVLATIAVLVMSTVGLKGIRR